MNPQLNFILAQQGAAELQGVAERTRLAASCPRPEREQLERRNGHEARTSGFTLRGHHLAKLDRFLGQAKRAAVREGREFGGVSIEIDADGVVTVHATGMTSMPL